MTQTFKLSTQARRNPSQNTYMGIEFDALFRNGIIAPGERVAIQVLDDTYHGVDALFARRGWDADITNPFGPCVFDCLHSNPAFPSNLHPIWNSLLQANGQVWPSAKRGFNASYGAKGMWIVGEGLTNINSVNADMQLNGYSVGTSYGNLAAILGNWAGKLAVKGVRFNNSDNGVRGAFDWYREENCTFERNGSGDGQTHNKYLDVKVVVMLGGISRDAKVGHNNKLISWLAIIDGQDNRNTVTVQGPSFDYDFNGGLVFLRSCQVYDLQGDSNQSVMIAMNTVRKPFGPHGLFLDDNKLVANLAYRGSYLLINNKAVLWSASPTWDYHTAPQLKNADGSDVWMPIDVWVKGNDAQYLNTALNYAHNNWNIPTNNGINQIVDPLTNNRLIAMSDPLAANDATTRNNAALALLGSLQSTIAAKVAADYTENFMDQLVTDITALRAAWTYPVPGTVLTPEDDEAMYKDLYDAAQAALATAQASLVTLNNTYNTDIAAKNAIIAARDATIVTLTAQVGSASTVLNTYKTLVKNKINALCVDLGPFP